MKQLGHHETLKKMPELNSDCVLYACGISSVNLGLMVRTADIFGVKALYYYCNEKSINTKQLFKVSRNSKIPLYFSDSLDTLADLKTSGYEIIALEITDASLPLRSASFPPKICLVIGNEQDGIPENILALANCAYYIEMVGGRISSLNVSIAASIALYEITRYHLEKG